MNRQTEDENYFATFVAQLRIRLGADTIYKFVLVW